MNLGCFELLKERLGFDYSLKDIRAKLGYRWRMEQVISLIQAEYGARETEHAGQGDIIISGRHIGIYSGAGQVEHRLKGRRVVTPMDRWHIDCILTIPGGAQPCR